MDFIKKYWGYLVSGLLIVIVLILFSLNGGKGKDIIGSDTVVNKYTKVDTIYKDTTITREEYIVKLSEVIQASKERRDSLYKVAGTYDSLLNQFNQLKAKHLSYYNYNDTIGTANGGYVALKDVVSENKIVSRKPTVFDRSKTVTIRDSIVTTITNEKAPNRQAYIGGELTGNPASPINGVNGLLMYKDRKDRVYQLKGGLLNVNGQVQPMFGIGLAWKIKL